MRLTQLASDMSAGENAISFDRLRHSHPALDLGARHQHPDRDAAMVAAYAPGLYSYREIAEYFGVHLAMAGRIVRAHLVQCEKNYSPH